VSRKLYIDWLRGVAVLLMINWHVVDAWTRDDARSVSLFVPITYLAGWAAPLFLFLAGVAVALAGAAKVSKGATRAAAARALMIRGWQVFAIAHLFRLQSFLLNPGATWESLLKPDVLNILGLGIVVSAWCWKHATSPRAEALWLIAPAAAAVLLTAPSRAWQWPSLLHPRLEAYIRPVGDQGVFTLFPTIAFVIAGTYVGALLARAPRATRRLGLDDDSYRHGALALAGVTLVAISEIGVRLPRVAPSAWIEPAWFVVGRTGAMILTLVGSWILMRHADPSRWRPLVVFGRTSLFVYWVHVELAYGVFSYPLHHALSLTQSLVAYVIFTVVMFGAATLWLNRRKGPLIPPHMAAARLRQPVNP